MPRAPTIYPVVETVARAIFASEQAGLLGHRVSQSWIDSGWERCSEMAYAAIKAYEKWAQANAGKV